MGVLPFYGVASTITFIALATYKLDSALDSGCPSNEALAAEHCWIARASPGTARPDPHSALCSAMTGVSVFAPVFVLGGVILCACLKAADDAARRNASRATQFWLGACALLVPTFAVLLPLRMDGVIGGAWALTFLPLWCALASPALPLLARGARRANDDDRRGRAAWARGGGKRGAGTGAGALPDRATERWAHLPDAVATCLLLQTVLLVLRLDDWPAGGVASWSPWAVLAPSWLALAAAGVAATVDASLHAVPRAGGLRRGFTHTTDPSDFWAPALLLGPLAIFLALVCAVWAADHARAPVPGFCAPALASGGGQPPSERIAGHNAGGFPYSSACFRSVASPLYVPLGIGLFAAMFGG